ncbi:hypothetical protein [Nocardiopsis metallicus]|uniref:Uncharacterized protein n=1 Tax=Nocardiopsis metallicus TaxID=179819 RepID=A0A840W464_9ACTN|nr:hypothetical protein [Nocardiopsis metallicus]MBB5490774.1 hypothetical protein [Nocardiopsis metallicus]
MRSRTRFQEDEAAQNRITTIGLTMVGAVFLHVGEQDADERMSVFLGTVAATGAAVLAFVMVVEHPRSEPTLELIEEGRVLPGENWPTPNGICSSPSSSRWTRSWALP